MYFLLCGRKPLPKLSGVIVGPHGATHRIVKGGAEVLRNIGLLVENRWELIQEQPFHIDEQRQGGLGKLLAELGHVIIMSSPFKFGSQIKSYFVLPL